MRACRFWLQRPMYRVRTADQAVGQEAVVVRGVAAADAVAGLAAGAVVRHGAAGAKRRLICRVPR